MSPCGSLWCGRPGCLVCCGAAVPAALAGETPAPQAVLAQTVGDALRVAIAVETPQPPSVAIDPAGDFVLGWEIEGMPLSRVAAELIDNQPRGRSTCLASAHAAGHRVVK